MHRFVSLADMQRLGIGIGIDRDRGDAHFARGTDDAAGDLAAIGDKKFLDHEALVSFAARELKPAVDPFALSCLGALYFRCD